MIRKIVHNAAREPSFREAAEAMNDLAEVAISGRQLDRIAHEVGEQLRADREERVDQLQAATLKPYVETRPALTVIVVDGGRLQIRGEGLDKDTTFRLGIWATWMFPSNLAPTFGSGQIATNRQNESGKDTGQVDDRLNRSRPIHPKFRVDTLCPYLWRKGIEEANETRPENLH